MRSTAIRFCRPARRAAAALLLPGMTSLLLAAGEAEPSDAARRQEKLRALGEEVERLRAESRALEGKEKGVLVEIERLDAELKLREISLREVSERISALEASIEERTGSLKRLEAAQGERRRYLAFRLREMYKRGPEASLRLLGEEQAESLLAGLRYAAYLSEKDRGTLASFREDAGRLEEERVGLLRDRQGLAASRDDADRARAELARSRGERVRYLGGIRRDRRRTQEALHEIELASKDLGGLLGKISEVPQAAPPAVLDLAKLRGTLDWPVRGKVVAGFGRMVHPQFKTVVLHPGLDIEAPEGTDIRAVLDGKVAYSSWLRGYGLTMIVDHGAGLLSVYAHAAVLLVEQGDQVQRGEPLGKVGETGSLRGPYLYFEIRQDGKPVDPTIWLRRR